MQSVGGLNRSDVINALKWSAAGKFAAQLLTWAMTLWVVRLLSPSDYGLMAMASIFIALLALMNEFGLSSAIIQRAEMPALLMRRAFGVVIVSNVACAAVLVLGAPLVASFFREPQLTSIVRVLSVQFVLSSWSVVPGAVLVRRLDFKNKTAVDVVAQLVTGVATVAVAYRGFGVWALVVGSLLGTLMKSVGYTLAARLVIRPSFSLRGVSDLLTYGGNIVMQRILWFIYTKADEFIIGRTLGGTPLGSYSVALHLASLPMQKMNELINQITLRTFAHLHSDGQSVSRTLLKTVRALSLGIFPLFFGISAVAPETVRLFLGAKWEPAILPLQLLPLVMPLRMLNTPLSETLNAVGRPDIVVVNQVLMVTLIPTAIYVGSHFGIPGVCVAWLVAFPIVFVISVIRGRSALGLGVRDLWSAVRSPASASLGMYAIVVVLRHNMVSGLAAPLVFLTLVASGVLVYGLLIRWFGWDQIIEARGMVASGIGK